MTKAYVIQSSHMPTLTLDTPEYAAAAYNAALEAAGLDGTPASVESMAALNAATYCGFGCEHVIDGTLRAVRVRYL